MNTFVTSVTARPDAGRRRLPNGNGIQTTCPGYGQGRSAKCGAQDEAIGAVSHPPVYCSNTTKRGHKLFQYSALEEKLALLSEAEIIFGTPSWMTNVIPRCTNLKWIQSITAGVDSVIKEVTEHKVNADIILTRNGETFVQPMSEHIITLILACNKGLYKCHEQQKQAIFQRRNILAKPLALSSVGILGLGCIGRETARICKAFGTKVWGMTRTTVSEDSKCPNVDEYRTMSDLHEILSECDYIVNILPSTAETRGILSGEVFSHCKMVRGYIY
ncbi:hydroxypyruvate reductase-like isoform X5 [Haliotis rubra]|uniref:hydroxypyruvate reductase-like isoform X5 n=1 Tax=Haliotis rubra TaxID=36100 RepID=UPI001EE54C91|nr:hydroxypyruvate reductase-like isoform X5 [Haliotis rubra]